MPFGGFSLARIARSTNSRRFLLIIFAAAALRASSAEPTHLSAAGANQAATAGAGSTSSVSYLRDIKPILTSRCFACHGNGTKLGGLSLESRSAMIAGGQSGTVVVPGKSATSLLVKLVTGGDPARIMPARGPRLTAAEIAKLRKWIDSGAQFDGADQADWTAILKPRNPALPNTPAALGLDNPIDRIVWAYDKKYRIAPQNIVDDQTYARRVSLDLVGLLPNAADIRELIADKSPQRREHYAAKLIGRNEQYATHWLSFWNDLLRNDYAGTGYIDGGRLQITNWLYSSLATNKPYDQFVAELIHPKPEAEGFTKGIVWRGVVNASQTPQMQAAQHISQVFMGVNLKCASCHNSFISNWKLADAYGMAGIYSDGPLETVRCDKPTGQIAPIKFLYPELGKIDAAGPKDDREAQLARILTSQSNGRLARTFVNRIWARLLGRGIVEPVDEMDNRPWNPDLLDWLAYDFQGHGYDVRRTLLQIVTSRAYQMPAMELKSELQKDFVFTGPAVKRMSAEQYVDALAAVTGVYPRSAVDMRIQDGKVVFPRSSSAIIQFDSGVMKSGSNDIDMDITGSQVLMLVATDAGDGNSFDWVDWANPRIVTPQGEVSLMSLPMYSGTTGYGTIQNNLSIVGKPIRLGAKTYAVGIGTHANSILTWLLPQGTVRFRATAGPDAGAIESAGSKTSVDLVVVTGDRSLVESRAALAYADPLMTALGRPNRDQVVTQRSTVATTLQALELTNGREISNMCQQGAAMWTNEPAVSSSDLIKSLYLRSLDRLPTSTELSAALDLVGQPAKKDGVEDLIWSIVMLPEFQLIY